jgi:DNA-binding transcriptional MerR regulator/predicted transcriptional regulator YdeE
MFSIGEFARHGRVSVRMLRHYDTIGLLRPACVDPVSGYRFYQASQLAELNRVIALKELGFTLQQVQSILAEKVSAAELRGMLKLRRAEIQAVLEAETTRLARVEARLLTIEDEARAPADGVVIKRLEPVRVGELTAEAAGWEPEAITPVIQPLYGALWQRMASAEVCAAGPALAYYEDAPAGEGAIVVHAAVPVAAEGSARSHGPTLDQGFAVVDLPAVERAAVIIHHGSMDDVMATGQALARWIDANGYRSAGYSREVTLEWSPDPEQWVTELQQPIHPTGD